MNGKTKVFRAPSRLVIGPGCLSGLSFEAARLGLERVVIVTDPGLIQAGILEKVTEPLEAGGVAYTVFSDVEPDPPYQVVETCLAATRGFEAHGVIGLGGGSALDVAKCLAVMLTNPGRITDYVGVDLVPGPAAPLLAIPTTAGTGSEVTAIAILSDDQAQLKKGLVSEHLIPRTALLDAELTLGLPPAVTAATGLDALTHAIEAYTSVNSFALADLLAVEAISLIRENLKTAVDKGHLLHAREAMLQASLNAGLAFGNAGVTAVHAFAYPIGARFHIPHGLANVIMLAPVMNYNIPGSRRKFVEVAGRLDPVAYGLPDWEATARGVEAVKKLRREVGLTQTLADFGVTEADIPVLAAEVMGISRLLANNPRPLSQQAAEDIYRQAL